MNEETQKVTRRVDASGPAWVMYFEINGSPLGHMYMAGPSPYNFEVYRSDLSACHRAITEDEAEQWLLTPNVQIEGRDALSASRSNAELGGKTEDGN